MNAPDALRRLANDYLEAFVARDLARCLRSYHDDASVHFQMASFTGPDEIAQWHADRFAANLRVLRVESVGVRGDTVRVDAVVASDRLAAWKIKTLRARATLRFREDRIVSASLMPRTNAVPARLRLIAGAGIVCLVGSIALNSQTPSLGAREFTPAAPQGFGDRQNSWPWSMQSWNGRLDVGTYRAAACVEQYELQLGVGASVSLE